MHSRSHACARLAVAISVDIVTQSKKVTKNNIVFTLLILLACFMLLVIRKGCFFVHESSRLLREISIIRFWDSPYLQPFQKAEKD